MIITPIPVFQDNWAYLLVDEATKEAAVVDPVEPMRVLSVVEKQGVDLKGILTTHHHQDHAGGNSEFLKQRPGLKVWGGDERIPGLTDHVKDGEPFQIGKLQITPLYTPCHTRGSVSFYIVDQTNNDKAVFTGDTLFIAGCGRFFEGTAEQMYHSLHDILGRLPKETKVFCGHEYTQSNLRFALHVEPDNKDVNEKLEWCRQAPTVPYVISEDKVEHRTRTVPSTIGDEFRFNPFMRLDSSSIRKTLGTPDATALEVMAKLRELKNNSK